MNSETLTFDGAEYGFHKNSFRLLRTQSMEEERNKIDRALAIYGGAVLSICVAALSWSRR